MGCFFLVDGINGYSNLRLKSVFCNLLSFIVCFNLNSLLFLLGMIQAVLEKQSYMLIGRHDIENLMGLDPASACLPNSLGPPNMENNASDAEGVEVELEISDLLMNLRPIKQVCICLVT